MPTLTERQVADAVSAARPDPVAIGSAWSTGRRERVLTDILASTDAETGGAHTQPHRSHLVLAGRARPAGTPARRRSRWALVAAASALLVLAGLVVQVVAPVGRPGSPQAAAALDRLAAAVPDGPVIPADAYELTVYEDSGIAKSDRGSFEYATQRSTWTASDGWSWAHQTGHDAHYYVFAPVPKNYDLHSVPADPALMEAYLRLRVGGSTSVEEAMFEAVRETLGFTPTPAATRVTTFRMLARIPGVTVTEGSTDPAGRPATRLSFVDEEHRPGIVNSIYLDAATTYPLADLKTQDGTPYYTRIYTERRVVAALPDDIVAVLGADRTAKEVRSG